MLKGISFTSISFGTLEAGQRFPFRMERMDFFASGQEIDHEEKYE
jgi:hypothetical protein